MDRPTEIALKEERIHRYLEQQGLGALVVARHENFAWLTAGGTSRIVATEEAGPVYLAITREGRYAFTNVSEARRVEEEELAGLGFAVRSCAWYEDPTRLLRETLAGRIAADIPLEGTQPAGRAFQRLRYSLSPAEEERYRWLCRVSAEAVNQVCREVQPGETELQVAGRLAALLAPHLVTPSVVLVAADDRIQRFRHPTPTNRPVMRYLMVVLVGERWGLHSAVTRFVHFGPVPAEISARLDAVTRVHQAMQGATKPGTPVAEVLQVAINAYSENGFPEEWQLHHQGGAIGYAPREYLATPAIDEVVQERQAFAWNPSITGAKVEDTILATAAGFEVLTATPDWPLVNGQPGILVR